MAQKQQRMSVVHNAEQHWLIVVRYLKPFLANRGWQFVLPEEEMEKQDWVAERARMLFDAIEKRNMLELAFSIVKAEDPTVEGLVVLASRTSEVQEFCQQFDTGREKEQNRRLKGIDTVFIVTDNIHRRYNLHSLPPSNVIIAPATALPPTDHRIMPSIVRIFPIKPNDPECDAIRAEKCFASWSNLPRMLPDDPVAFFLNAPPNSAVEIEEVPGYHSYMYIPGTTRKKPLISEEEILAFLPQHLKEQL